MKNRLKALIDYLGISHTTFARNIGVSPTAVKKYLDEKNMPKDITLLKIKDRYPTLNLEWLRVGKGEMWEYDYFKDRFLIYGFGNKTIKEKIDALVNTFDCNYSILANRLGVDRAYLSAIYKGYIKTITKEKIEVFNRNIDFIPKEWWK